LKSARERMDIISAYREVGSYRDAAAISGTTAKTVKRVIARHLDQVRVARRIDDTGAQLLFRFIAAAHAGSGR
jgi:hypothetical protein